MVHLEKEIVVGIKDKKIPGGRPRVRRYERSRIPQQRSIVTLETCPIEGLTIDGFDLKALIEKEKSG